MQVTFNCEKCGKPLDAWLYDNDQDSSFTIDTIYCGCGNVYDIIRPILRSGERSFMIEEMD